MLNFLEVVLRVAVDDHLTKVDAWVVRVRPYFSYIKDVPLISKNIKYSNSLLVAISLRHNLNLNSPSGSLATL